MAQRLQAMGAKGYENGFNLSILPERLVEPLNRRKPTTYFVNSMSDLFHNDIPFEFLDQVFDVIKRTPQHTYQILTKRASRMRKYFVPGERFLPRQTYGWASRWKTENTVCRVLMNCEKLRPVSGFLSVEPLLEDLGQNRPDRHSLGDRRW